MLRPWGPDSNPSSTRTVPRDRPGRHSALWNTEKKNQDVEGKPACRESPPSPNNT